MNAQCFFKAWFLSMGLLCSAVGAHAQAGDNAEFGVRVAQLTDAERDTLSGRFNDPDAVHLVYACVPAGVLVFADGSTSRSGEGAREAMRGAVATLIDPARITDDRLTLRAAENDCAQTRGR